jgi:hypothetical protein
VRLAKENLDWQVDSGVARTRWAEEETETITFQLSRLTGQMLHWHVLVKDLVKNVESLEHTIEHTRMDLILYEQQQARSDQEALAEIERGRLSRPEIVRPPSNAAYNVVMLLLTAAAGVLTLTSSSFRQLWRSGAGWWDFVLTLWPLWAMIVFAYGVVPTVRWAGGRVRQGYRAKRVKARSYPYEFAFQIEQPVDLRALNTYAGNRDRRTLAAAGRSFFITNRGFGRVELLFRDSRVLKIHSAGALSLGWWRYAHFEIIHEVRVQRIAAGERQMLAQCRVFGEAPRPLSTVEVEGIAAAVLDDIASTVVPEYAPRVHDLMRAGLVGLTSEDRSAGPVEEAASAVAPGGSAAAGRAHAGPGRGRRGRGSRRQQQLHE